LSILGPGRVLWDDLESELHDSGQLFRGVLGGVSFRVLGAQALDLREQRCEGVEKLRVRKDRPALDDQGWIGRAAGHSKASLADFFKSMQVKNR
jgi:hypothetical protein